MRRCGTKLILLLGAMFTQFSAHAFFDDFLGDHLNDNWSWGGWRDATFHVADSYMTVTDVQGSGGEWYTADLHSGTGYNYPNYREADFTARLKVSWAACDSQQSFFTVGTLSHGYVDVAQFRLVRFPTFTYLTLGTGGRDSQTLVLEPAGTHEFQVDRVNGNLLAYLDGELFYTSSDGFHYGYIADVTFSFAKSNGPFQPIGVDYVSVEVVPEPSCLFGLGVMLSCVFLRRIPYKG